MIPEAMTRERMLALQAAPRRHLRIYKLTREGAMKVAIGMGRIAVAAGTDPETGWWPEMARLTPAEKRRVRGQLTAERDGTADT